jgi:hypothetical protein
MSFPVVYIAVLKVALLALGSVKRGIEKCIIAGDDKVL